MKTKIEDFFNLDTEVDVLNYIDIDNIDHDMLLIAFVI